MRMAPLAISVPLALTACWGPPPATPIAGGHLAAQHLGDQVIDLTGGNEVRPGYGRLTVHVDVGSPPPGRTVQDVGTSQTLIVVITKPDGRKVTDENNHDAVYKGTVSNGSATINLPGLPPTTATPGSLTNAYVVTTLIGNWHSSGSTKAVPGDVTYTSITNGFGQFDYGTNGPDILPPPDFTPLASDAFVFSLDSDASTSVEVAGAGGADGAFPHGRLLRSGFGRASVTSGLSTSVSVENFEHFVANFVTSGSSRNVSNVTSLKNLKAQGTSLKMRHPGLTLDSIEGTPKKVRYVFDLEDDPLNTNSGTTDDLTFTAAPSLVIHTYNTMTGATDSATVTIGAFSTTVTNESNTGYANSKVAGKLAWADVDFTNLNSNTAAKNVLDFRFSGLPSGATLRLYALPLGTSQIVSGPFAPSILQ